MTRLHPLRLIQALTLALAAQMASAAPVTLSYAGSGTPEVAPGAVSVGQGVLNSKSGSYSGLLTLDDLQDFRFDLSFEHQGLTDLFSFGLADLEAFSMVVGADGIESFSLRTSHQRASHFWGTSLAVFGLDAGDALTQNFDLWAPITTGQFAAKLGSSQVPEPASLALVLGGLGLAAWTSSRRKPAAKPAC